MTLQKRYARKILKESLSSLGFRRFRYKWRNLFQLSLSTRKEAQTFLDKSLAVVT